MAKLNLGCKHRKLSGFDNLDKIYGWLFQNGLPQYGDGTVEGITISHALMFLTVSELAKFMGEMWRVLRVGGVVRITEDDTENPQSDTYRTGCIASIPRCLTGPKMMRAMLENAGFKVYDVDQTTTYFIDKSLMQAYRGGSPKRFFIEGIKSGKIMNTLDYIIKKYCCSLADRIEIPNVGRDDLAILLHELDFKTGAEIGVERGYYSEVLVKANPQMKIFGVDPWESLETCKDNAPKRRTENHRSQARINMFYEEARARLAPYPNYEIMKEYSIDAVKRFEDGSLDFVYIDANHEYSFVMDDMSMWSRKIRQGGIVSGHDYYNTTGSSRFQLNVKQAVNNYVAQNHIKPLIIWGAHAKVPRVKRDTWRSWMWVK